MSESVYGLIQPEAAVAAKESRYRSRAAPPPTASTFGFHGTSLVMGNVAGETALGSLHPEKKAFATFGRAVLDSVDTKSFLKKSASGNNNASTTKALSPHQHEKKKPSIPKKEDKPVMGLKTDKNFVVANAVENILSIAKKQQPQQHARPLDRPDYGQVPEYIHKVKDELKTQYSLVDSFKQRKAKEAERFSELSPIEVQELRSGLQRRWETLNKEFQTMGFSVETYSQKRHQEEVESELRAVEAALQKINKPHIFVYDDTK